MKAKQILSIKKKEKKQMRNLSDELLGKCYIDALTGKFHCSLCNNVVHIDLSRGIVFCPVHGMLIQ